MTTDTAPATPAVAGRTVHHWTLWSWTMLAVAIVVVAVGILTGVLMPAVLLDVVSFWPMTVVALLVAVAVRPATRRGAARLAAAAPLVLLSTVVAAVGLHLSAWDALPSAAADLVGPDPSGVETAELSISVSGSLSSGEATGALYEVRLRRAGGTVGVPEAVERIEEGKAFVDVAEADGGRLFRTNGWSLVLHDGPSWSLTVEAGAVALDLSTFTIDHLTVSGSGSVSLPAPPAGSAMSIVVTSGRLEIGVPAGVPARVRGRAAVPSSWTAEESGSRSPVERVGIDITVGDAASVIVVER